MTLRMSQEEYDAYMKRRTLAVRSKYKNIPTDVEGLKFHSKAEANYYRGLCQLRDAGKVSWFIRQPSFDLPGGVKYRADFLVVYPDRVEVIDVKGHRTETFKVKRKIVEALYPIKILLPKH